MITRILVVAVIAAIVAFTNADSSRFGYSYPAGIVYRKVGDSLNIICTLNITSELAEGKNSSDLWFVGRNKRFNPSLVKVLNETSIQLSLDNLTEHRDMIVCKLSDKDAVDYTHLLVGHPPDPVKNFKCRSYNWQYMECHFEAPMNTILPTYTLNFAMDRKPLQASMLRNYFTDTSGPLDTLNSTVRARLYSDKALRKLSPKLKISVNTCGLTGDRRKMSCKIEFGSAGGVYRQHYPYYFFKLHATSIVGNLTENFDVDHYSNVIPNAPENFHAHNWTSDSAVLAWNVNYYLKTFPRNFTFRINYTSSYMNGNWRQIPDFDSGTREFGMQLKHLEYAYDWYDMRISTKVDTAEDIPEMWSSFANCTFQTSSRTPDDPPKTDQGSFSINDHGHVFVYWRELHMSLSNGPNLRYEITLLNNGSLTPNELISTMAKYESLEGKFNDTLEFSIRSVNDVGGSKEASRLRIPAVRQRLAPPLNIKKFLHNRVYNLTWMPPHDSAPVESYTVFWCNSTDEQSGQCTSPIDFERVDGSVRSFMRPLNGTTLNFAVSANSPASSSGMVWSKCTASPNSEIGKLVKVWIKELHSTYMVFEWMLSCVDHAILKGFRVTYCPINDPKLQDCRTEAKSIEILGERNGFNLTGLKPYTTYKTYIQMFSVNSIGPNSDNLVNTTMETAPSPPRNLRYEDPTNTTVTLIWDEPEQYNGVLAKYEIHYNFDKRVVEANKSKQLRYVLDHLDSYTEYEIVVWACTNGGNACSKRSNSVKMTTAIGTPGNLNQAKTAQLSAAGYSIYSWSPPEKPAGPIDYYEVKLRLILGNMEREKIVHINGTRCTMTKKHCNGEIDFVDFSVRSVNVVQSAHAKTKRDLAEKYIEMDTQLDFDDSMTVLKRASNANIVDGSRIQNVQSVAEDSYNTIKYSNKDAKVMVDDESVMDSTRPPFPSLDLVCEEQVDELLDQFMEQDRFARHLRGEWSTPITSHCEHGNVNIFSLLIVFLLILTIAFVYASFYAMKKIRKMKDIGVELPAGLENIKDDSMGKGFECKVETFPDLKRDRAVEVKYDIGEKERLMRVRIESGSSMNTDSSGHCECNEALDDSEYDANEPENGVHGYQNSPDNSSPTPLLQVKLDSPMLKKKDPVASSVMASPFGMSSNGYVHPSALIHSPPPPPMMTNNGYVTHEAILGQPVPSSGYTSWATLEAQAPPAVPMIQTPLTPQTPLSPLTDDVKVKTPIVASTDVNGISGYVTHKQLSDFGHMMQ